MTPRTSIQLTALAVAVLLLVVALVRNDDPATGERLSPSEPTASDRENAPPPPPEDRTNERRSVEHSEADGAPAPVALEAAPLLVLTGRVVEEQSGRPLAGAWIERAPREGDERAPLRANCDADGRFRLEGVRDELVDRPAYSGDPRWPTLSLRAGAEDVPARWFRFADPAPERAMELELALPRGTRIRGRVLDLETRSAIADARVRCSSGDSSDETRTAADGGFELTFVPAEASRELRIEAIAPGWCQLVRSAAVPAADGDAPVLLFLPRATWIEGRVVDEAGAPVAGAEVRVESEGYGGAIDLEQEWSERLRERGVELEGVGGGVSVERGDEPVASAADGSFRSPDQLPWRRDVVVSARLADGRAASALVECLGAPGEPTRVELSLGRHPGLARVRGRVTLNGEPVTRGGVHWSGPTRRGDAELDEAGRYLLTGVEPGRVVLRAMPEVDLLPFPWLEDQVATLELAPGELRAHDLALEHRRSTISGRIAHLDGSPQPGVAVGARDAEGNGSLAAASDAEGRYVLELPDAEATYEVVAAIGSIRLSTAGVRAGSEDVDFFIPNYSLVRLSALDARTGRSLPPRFDCEWRRTGEPEYQLAPPLASAPDGEGRLLYLFPAGRLDLFVHAGRSGYRPARADGMKLRPGELRELELRLEPGLSLELLLADDAEPPPRDCAILLLEEAAASFVERAPHGSGARWRGHPELPGGALPSRELRFSSLARRGVVSGLAPGRYRLRAFPNELALEPATIELAGDGPSAIELRCAPRADSD